MPVAVAPSPLAPGFPRTWPECRPAMQAIARHLLARDATDEEVIACLMEDFPALPGATKDRAEADRLWWAREEAWRKSGGPIPPPTMDSGAALRQDVYFANVVADEKMYLSRHPDLAEGIRDEPSGYELQVVTAAAELLRLCASYGITFTLDAHGDQLLLSRKVMIGGPCHTLITRYKPEIIRMAPTWP